MGSDMSVSPAFLAVLRAHLGSLRYFDIKADPSTPSEYCPTCPPGVNNLTSVLIFPRPRANDPFAWKGKLLGCAECAPGLLAAVRNQAADEMATIKVRVRPQ